MAGVLDGPRAWLHARADRDAQAERSCARRDAGRASRRESAAALAARYPPGRRQPEHLDAYLNEFTFRFNRRHSRRRGMLFYRLLEQSIAADPITYRSLVVNPQPTGRRSPPARPGRVAAVPAVHRPWRENAAAMGLPDSNG